MSRIEDLSKCCQKILSSYQAREFNPDSKQQLDLEDLLKDFAPELSARLREEFKGYGPLSSLMNDRELTEIIINGPHQIWIEKAGKIELWPDQFLSEITFNNCIHRIATEIQNTPDLNIPYADGIWRHFRVHLIQPPLSDKTQLTLRVQNRDVWSFNQLLQKNWCDVKMLETLKNWIKNHENFLIVGPTGSGKTSVLNACLQEMNPNERVICLEDTPELKPKEGASCKLLTRYDRHGILKEFSLSDLVRQSLRMRPSRIVLGEVRGPEAKDLLLALATGHKGSLGTLHASNPRQALLRLEMLVQLGAGQWDLQAIRQLIQLSLDGIVMIQQNQGARKLQGLYRIASLESFGLLLEQV